MPPFPHEALQNASNHALEPAERLYPPSLESVGGGRIVAGRVRFVTSGHSSAPHPHLRRSTAHARRRRTGQPERGSPNGARSARRSAPCTSASMLVWYRRSMRLIAWVSALLLT